MGGMKTCNYPGCDRPIRKDNLSGFCTLHWNKKICPGCGGFMYYKSQLCNKCRKRHNLSKDQKIDLKKLDPIIEGWHSNTRRIKIRRPPGWWEEILKAGREAERRCNSMIYKDWDFQLDSLSNKPPGRGRRGLV